jgi:hypothetical protein
MGRMLLCLVGCLVCNGCASLVPLSSLLTTPSSSTPPLELHERTTVELANDNFLLVKTNVVGRSRGFSLLGIITIVPATLTKAMSQMYMTAAMSYGQPQTFAHLVVERTSTYWILFGVPEVDVRADIVEFKPNESHPAIRPPAKPPDTPR